MKTKKWSTMPEFNKIRSRERRTSTLSSIEWSIWYWKLSREDYPPRPLHIIIERWDTLKEMRWTVRRKDVYLHCFDADRRKRIMKWRNDFFILTDLIMCSIMIRLLLCSCYRTEKWMIAAHLKRSCLGRCSSRSCCSCSSQQSRWSVQTEY